MADQALATQPTVESTTTPPPSGRSAKIRQTLLADLFPAAPPPRRIRSWHILGMAAVWTALVATSLVRQSGPGALDTVWAEDGAVFLSRALQTSALDTVAEPYAGYLHVVPRLGAELVTLLPLTRAANALALLGAGITAATALLVYAASAGHLRSVTLRALLAGMVVLHPILLPESLNSLAFTQWPLTYAAFWLALWRPARTSASLLASIVLFLTVLSAPFAAILLPVLLLRSAVLHGWRDRIPAVLFLAGLALQLWGVLALQSHVSQPPGGTPEQLLAVYRVLAAAPAAFGFIGVKLTAELREALELSALLLWPVVTLVALRRSNPHGLTALLAAGVSLAILTVSIYVRGSAPVILDIIPSQGPGATRHGVVPVLLLITVLALAIDVRPRRIPAPAWQHLQVGVLAFLLFVAGGHFFRPNSRSAGPSWSAEVTKGVHACQGGAQEVVLETSPGGMGWQLQVPCARLPQ